MLRVGLVEKRTSGSSNTYYLLNVGNHQDEQREVLMSHRSVSIPVSVCYIVKYLNTQVAEISQHSAEGMESILIEDCKLAKMKHDRECSRHSSLIELAEAR